MKIYQGIEQFKKLEKAVVTTGTFDGVHIGHRTILNRVNELAKKIKGESVLLTFHPHPRTVLQKDADMKLLNTIEEKTKLLEKSGINHLIIHPFTMEFSRTSSLAYVRDILVNQIGTKKLVIGYDHHFGRNRRGGFEHLKEYGPLYGFEVEEIPAQEIDNVNISSTKIRKALIEGDVKTANTYLGHAFQLTGEVVHGNKIGRELGYPTANVAIKDPHKLIPAEGVYAVNINIQEKTYNGMLSIGRRPTIYPINGKQTIEVNIFDFNEDIYGETIELLLIDRIRDEKKFDNKEKLIEEMQKDKVRCERILLH